VRKSLAAAGLGAAARALPGLALADGPESAQIGEIYQLQAAFHRAKTTQDLKLTMSLWADDATFTNRCTGLSYVGSAQIKGFWQGSGSFVNLRFSLVRSYKTTRELARWGHDRRPELAAVVRPLLLSLGRPDGV
jgi:hypothetical protein